MQKILFIDRDGTIVEEPQDEQIDSFEKLKFVKGVFKNLRFIAEQLNFRLVMVTNQDGLGTPAFPEAHFYRIHNFILQTLQGEGITFHEQLIDRHFPHENSPMRKPATGMLTHYINNPAYDIPGSYVIGDRETDRQLAQNLGCTPLILGTQGITWDKITEILFAGERTAEITRTTKETNIHVKINLDRTGTTQITTGLGFFDHMLQQIAKHAQISLIINTQGDLQVDEHHTIEDTAIALGQCLRKALGNKQGIERYGFTLPMDDSLAQVAIDFGDRPWFMWDATFKREKIGDMPTEMFQHFFKTLADEARINLNIKAQGTNEHHKIEAIFKALARAIKMAIHRDIYHYELPSTKGTL